MTKGLSTSRIVSIAVDLSPPAPQAENLNTLLIVGTSSVINVSERMREYQGISGVAADFGTTAPEYLGALRWFSQVPQPTSLYVGRWANAATTAQLVSAYVTNNSMFSTIAALQGIADGGFNVTMNGVFHQVGSLNFTACGNLNAVAAVITTALNGIIGGTTCLWDANYNVFRITLGPPAGTGSTISFISTANAVGVTDVSYLLQMQVGDSGAYTVAGIAAETALTAVTTLDSQFADEFYGLVVLGAADTDHLAIAAYVEADATRHYYGVTTNEAGVLVATSTTDVAAELAALNLNHTAIQYSSTSAYSIISYLARILTTDFSANNSTITLKFKQEPLEIAETLNLTQITALEAKNCNVFVNYDDDTAIVEQGVSCSGQFTDTIVGLDWFANEVQNNVYTLLYQSPTKIPNTDAGNHQVATEIADTCVEGVNNGLFAPGVWNQPGFGSLQTGDTLKTGFYVYQPPVSSLTAAQRSARKSVPFQVAVNLASAIHSVNATVVVNT